MVDKIMTDDEKEAFIVKYYKDGDYSKLAAADDNIKEQFKKFLDELCEKDDLTAIKIKGYCTYGEGNPVYDCDWETSRDCMLKLVEKADDSVKAYSANTLGYIYYYGRCNGGVPQYDEAAKYFGMGAAFGVVESMYKYGDMLMKGVGIPQNKTAALQIYQNLYDDQYEGFAKYKIHNKFADIALRIASYYAEDDDKELAYEYCLQAWYAIQLRKKLNYYGDKTVAAGIKKLLDELKVALGDRVSEKQEVYSLHNLIYDMLTNCGKIDIRVVEKENGRYFKLKSCGNDFFMVISNMSFCQHVKKLKVKSWCNTTNIKFLNRKRKCKVDEYNSLTGICKYKGKQVAKISSGFSDGVVFYESEEAEKISEANEKVTFVKIKIKGKRKPRTSIFIDYEDISVGDTVWIYKNIDLVPAKVLDMQKIRVKDVTLPKNVHIVSFVSTG